MLPAAGRKFTQPRTNLEFQLSLRSQFLLKDKERFRNPSEPQPTSSSSSGSMRRKRSRPVMASGDLDPALFSFESMDESEALSFVNPRCENGGAGVHRQYDFAT